MLRYNAALPSKFMPAPGYGAYVAPEKYAQVGWILGLGGKTEETQRDLFSRVEQLLDEVGEPRSLADAGVSEEQFQAVLPDLARTAFMDPSIRTNPRIPLVKEVIALLQAGYAGWTG